MTLPELLQLHQIPFRNSHRQGEVYICCPFCQDRGEPTPDTKFRMGVNFVRDQGHCFRCEWASSTNAVQTITNAVIDSPVAVRMGRLEEKEEEQELGLPEDFELLTEISRKDEAAYQAYEYMKRRGFDRDMMKRKKLGVSMSGRYAYRVIFPVYWQGELKTLVARDFTNTAKAKYLNSHGTKYLYNMPDRTDRVTLAEGAIKALAIERVIQEPAAALLGHSITDNMHKQLKIAKVKEVVLWPDPDMVGIKGAVEVARELLATFRVSLIFPFPTAQADDMTTKDIYRAFRKRRKMDSKTIATLERQVQAKIAFRQ